MKSKKRGSFQKRKANNLMSRLCGMMIKRLNMSPGEIMFLNLKGCISSGVCLLWAIFVNTIFKSFGHIKSIQLATWNTNMGRPSPFITFSSPSFQNTTWSVFLPMLLGGRMCFDCCLLPRGSYDMSTVYFSFVLWCFCPKHPKHTFQPVWVVLRPQIFSHSSLTVLCPHKTINCFYEK